MTKICEIVLALGFCLVNYFVEYHLMMLLHQLVEGILDQKMIEVVLSVL
jgi:hypothetical protein